MKKSHVILDISILSIVVLIQLCVTVSANAAQKTPLSQCDCDFKESLKKGDWQKACQSAEDIVKTSPDSPEAENAYLWLGLYHKTFYDYSKSTEYYQKAAQKFQGTWTLAEATARMGCNQYKMNNFSKALEYYRKAGEEAKTWQQRNLHL
jgi:tetratricopeptide (TPR) repeat protein